MGATPMPNREGYHGASLTVYQGTEGHWSITEGGKAIWLPSRDQFWGLHSRGQPLVCLRRHSYPLILPALPV